MAQMVWCKMPGSLPACPLSGIIYWGSKKNQQNYSLHNTNKQARTHAPTHAPTHARTHIPTHTCIHTHTHTQLSAQRENKIHVIRKIWLRGKRGAVPMRSVNEFFFRKWLDSIIIMNNTSVHKRKWKKSQRVATKMNTIMGQTIS